MANSYNIGQCHFRELSSMSTVSALPVAQQTSSSTQGNTTSDHPMQLEAPRWFPNQGKHPITIQDGVNGFLRSGQAFVFLGWPRPIQQQLEMTLHKEKGQASGRGEMAAWLIKITYIKLAR